MPHNVLSTGVNCCCCDLWHERFDDESLLISRWEFYNVLTGAVAPRQWQIQGGAASCTAIGHAMHLKPSYVRGAQPNFVVNGPFFNVKEIGVRVPRLWHFSCDILGDGGACFAFDPSTGVPPASGPTEYDTYTTPRLLPYPKWAFTFKDSRLIIEEINSETYASVDTPIPEPVVTKKTFDILVGLQSPLHLDVWASPYHINDKGLVDGGCWRMKVNDQWITTVVQLRPNQFGFEDQQPFGFTGINPVFFTIDKEITVKNCHWEGYDFKARPDCKCCDIQRECWMNCWPWKKADTITLQFGGFEVEPEPREFESICADVTSCSPFTGLPMTWTNEPYVTGYDIWHPGMAGVPVDTLQFPKPAPFKTYPDLLLNWLTNPPTPPVDPLDCYQIATLECHYCPGLPSTTPVARDIFEFNSYLPSLQDGTFVLKRVKDRDDWCYCHELESWVSDPFDYGCQTSCVIRLYSQYGYDSTPSGMSASVYPFLEHNQNIVYILSFTFTVTANGPYYGFSTTYNLPIGGEYHPSDPLEVTNTRVLYPTTVGDWTTKIHLGWKHLKDTFTGDQTAVYYKFAGTTKLTPNYNP